MSARVAATAALLLLLAVGATIYSEALGLRPLGGDNLYVLAWVDHASIPQTFRLDPAIYPEWRPLAYQTIWLEHRLHPFFSGRVHFVINLLIWLACPVVVYHLVYALTTVRLVAFVAAARLLVDDRSIEAVTGIVERQTSLACLCGLLAILIVVKARQPLARSQFGAVVLLLLCSALSKEYGLAFAGAMVAHGLWHRRHELAWAATAAGLSYVVLRIGLADGAFNGFCQEMGFFHDVRQTCVVPLSGPGFLQMAYNVGATLIATPLPGLFDDHGTMAIAHGRLLVPATFLVVAVIGVVRGDARVRLIALVPIANGLLSFMLFRSRNQLIGAAALAVLVGVGLSRLRLEWAAARFNLALRVAAAVVMLIPITRQAISTHRATSVLVYELLGEDPCDDPLREDPFGDDYVKQVKARYEMSNPTCEGTK